MGRGFEFVLFAAFFLLAAFVVSQIRRRERSDRFAHRGRIYERRPDGSFVTETGLTVTGAAAIGALATAYAEQCSAQGGEAASGSDGGDGGGGDGGGGGD